MFRLLCLFALAWTIEYEGCDREDVFVLQCQMETNDQRHILHGLVKTHELDLWYEGIPRVGDDFSLLVSQPQADMVMEHFSCHHPKSLALYKMERMPASKSANTAGFFGDYQSYQDILERLDSFNKTMVRKFGSLGKSVEGRSIPVIHLTSPKSNATRPVLWISGGQHAREWIGVAAVMYLADQLVNLYGLDPVITTMMDTFEFAIAPIINPDGYEWSRTSDRMWRKNRVTNRDGTKGVDLNRNWDSHWGEVGASRVPQSQTYQGPKAHSEPEVRLTAEYIKSLKNRVAGVDVHSFGQLILRNYGWTVRATNKETYLKRLGDSIANAMNSVYQSNYISQRSSALYPSGGSMDDWMFDKTQMPGFTIELRDQGEWGFLLPAEYIIPTGEELVAGILALANQIMVRREM